MRKSYRSGVAALLSLGGDHRRVSQCVLRLEALEDRALMTALPLASDPVATTDISVMGVSSNTPYGYTPAQIRQAYGFNNVSFGGVTGNGAGQTIAIIDAYGDPNIASDLAHFDATFGIANPPNFSVENETGGSALPAANSTWDLETALDVEWAHAIAPGANIVLVEANSSNLSDLLTAVNTARNTPSVSVVSMSWGTSDFQGENYFDSYFTTPAGHTGITFVASSGDTGAPSGWPALSSNVLAVGGTSLSIGAGGTYQGETAWSDSGGSVSSNESEPSYQRMFQSTGYRSAPDVSYDANPTTGFAVYDSVAYGSQSGWFEVGGTSAGAPQWAGLITIADQGRSMYGLGTLNGAQAAIYSLPSTDFHDITSGGNNEYSAHSGYDFVTGRGSPIANLVIDSLVGSVTQGNTSAGYAYIAAESAGGSIELGGISPIENGPGGDGAGGNSAGGGSNLAGTINTSIFDVSATSLGAMQVAEQGVNGSAAAVAQFGPVNSASSLSLLMNKGPFDLQIPASGSGSEGDLDPALGDLNGSTDNHATVGLIPGSASGHDTPGSPERANGAADAAQNTNAPSDGSPASTEGSGSADNASGATDTSGPPNAEHGGEPNARPGVGLDSVTQPVEASAAAALDAAQRAIESVWADTDFALDELFVPATEDRAFASAEHHFEGPVSNSAAHALAGIALASVTTSWIREPGEAGVRGSLSERQGKAVVSRERGHRPTAC